MALRTLPAARPGGDALPIPKPRSHSLDLTQVRRERLEALVEVLIDMLDALDESDDRDPTADDDCCPAHDDAPAWAGGHGLPGDPDDAEPCDDDEASAQATMTPDSARPTAPAVWL